MVRDKPKTIYVGNTPLKDCVLHWMLETFPRNGWFDGTCYECDRRCQVKKPAEWVSESFVGETIKGKKRK
jgi:hypothetical protein